MKISSLIQQGKKIYSFEVFPPKRDAAVEGLYTTFKELKHLKPAYISVTYGAGGSTQERTEEIASHLKKMGIEPLMHLTCVGKSRSEIKDTLDELKDLGIENVLALRGDPPKGEENFVKPADGFGYANELVEFIKKNYDFCVGVAAYPDGHPAAKEKNHDLLMLKQKLDAGADFANTQMFFDNKVYFDFVKRAKDLGITQPIFPGVMPVLTPKYFQRDWGVSFPEGFKEKYAGATEEEAKACGLKFTAEQSKNLMDEDAPGLHLYIMNRSFVATHIHERLGQIQD